MEEFQFELLGNIGAISENSRGWSRELNIIRWNGKAPKYDLRDWSPDRMRMSKGISMTTEELIQLRDLLIAMDLETVSGKK